jgi:hypothetical protein
VRKNEIFAKRSILFKVKEDEDFNRRKDELKAESSKVIKSCTQIPLKDALSALSFEL